MSEETQNSQTQVQHNLEDEIRCMKCGKLIAKTMAHGHFEVKCPRCGTLNAVFEQMIEQVIVTDPEGKILYINKAAELATGYGSAEAIGKRPSDLWGGEMPGEFYAEMWRTIKDEKKSFQAGMVNKHKNGTLYDLELIISPILDTDGNVMFYVGIEVATKKDS